MSDEAEKTEPMQLGPEIVRRITRGSGRVWLVCPYVTSDLAVVAFRDSNAPSRRLLTRYNVSDIAAGATDLRAIVALVEAGVDVRALEDIHAKVYIVDEWAYVGSANLTERGLGSSLREFGVTSDEVNLVEEACRYFELVWNQAHTVSQERLATARDQLDHMRSDVEAACNLRSEIARRLAFTSFAPRAPLQRTRSTAGVIASPAEGVLFELSGSMPTAQSVARIFAHAIRSVPNFATSEHWTINEPQGLLRLNLGSVEILTMNSWGLGVVALSETLSQAARGEIENAGGSVQATRYRTVERVSPGGLRISLPLSQVTRFEKLLCANLEAYIARDTSTARTQYRRALSIVALRTIARIANDGELAALASTLGSATTSDYGTCQRF